MACMGRVASAAGLTRGAKLGARFSTMNVIDASKTVVTRTKNPKPRLPKEKLVFGQTMSDHMLEVDWDSKKGWSTPVISPYHMFQMDPSCNALHYGVEAFEGMKAYRDAKGRVRLFRPDLNMIRMASSMDRLCLPVLDKAGWLECIKQLVKTDADWIPEGEGFSLYIRPTVIGTQNSLGVSRSLSCKLFAITSPVGPYYPEGFKPVKLLAESKAHRAWPGGTGDAKIGGNYAPTIRVQAAAAEKGYSQVLWLYGGDHQVTEVGTMNFFVFWRNAAGEQELVTAPLDGTILPGVTRQSILDLSREWGEFKVSERSFTMAELSTALKAGRVTEAFGAGTAAVVSPVKGISYLGVDYDVPLDKANPAAGAGRLTQRIWDSLARIQYGHAEHPWSVVL